MAGFGSISTGGVRVNGRSDRRLSVMSTCPRSSVLLIDQTVTDRRVAGAARDRRPFECPTEAARHKGASPVSGSTTSHSLSGNICPMADRDEPIEREPRTPSILPHIYLDRMTPAEALAHLVEVLHTTDDPDPDLCLEVGCGDLESVLRDHESELWDEVERLARNDVRFRRALSSVWAYDSPEVERRTALLAELGEQREITVRFTVEPADFSADPRLSWRAFECGGGITNRRLAEALRRVAEWLDRQPPDADAGHG